MMPSFILFVMLIIILLIIVTSCIKIVPQEHAYILERLGTYMDTWPAGLHFKVPFIDRIARRVNLKEQVVDFPPQPVITKDNVTMQIDSIVFFRITDAKLYTYGVESPIMAIENLTATTLRNIIGDMELDETLTSREIINTRMRSSLDVATDPWGIKVTRVELKNITPPTAIREAMEKQMKAERERREQIIRAEGEKQAAITVSEGEKEAKILRATADKEATILAAEAKKQAAILEAQAQREAAIQRAQGNAEAIRQVQQAEADAVRMMNEAAPSQATIAVRGLSTFERASQGPANKLIIPSELAGVTGLATAVTEAIKTGKEAPKTASKAE